MSENKNITQGKITTNHFSNKTEEERLRADVFRPDKEKLALFTKMLRTNALYKRAVITHKNTSTENFDKAMHR